MTLFADDEAGSRELETYEFPLAKGDEDEIKRMLREREVFTPSFIPQDDDVYDPLMYRRQSLQHHTSTILLADRNVVTRWLSLVTGAKVLPEHKIPAAIMAFAQSSNMLVEPNLALYEAAATAGTEAANDELRLFRIADNIDTHHWANVALERTERLPLSEIQWPSTRSEVIDFDMPLRRWRRNYIILLKLAELELQGADRTKQITELARWMFGDFIIGGPALVFAVHYLAPNSARGRLLKSLRSSDREKALRGIRNASWDLTLLSDWILRIDRQKAENTLTLLCSLDRKLMQLANMIAPRSNDQSSSGSFLKLSFTKILEPWGVKKSQQLAELIEDFLTDTDNPTRQIHRPEEVNIDELIAEGEKTIRDFSFA